MLGLLRVPFLLSLYTALKLMAQWLNGAVWAQCDGSRNIPGYLLRILITG